MREYEKFCRTEEIEEKVQHRWELVKRIPYRNAGQKSDTNLLRIIVVCESGIGLKKSNLEFDVNITGIYGFI
jgi:hypothetical protein